MLTCYVYSTKIGEISDISKCFENFVSQALGVLTRIYAAELRNKMIGGVCAGLAEYLDIDPTIVRIVWVLMVLFAGFGILLYIIFDNA